MFTAVANYETYFPSRNCCRIQENNRKYDVAFGYTLYEKLIYRHVFGQIDKQMYN